MEVSATKVLEFDGRLVSVKHLEDEEGNKTFLVLQSVLRSLPIWTNNH